MPSQFVCQFTKPLIHSFVYKPPFPLRGESTADALSSSDPSKKHALHALLVSLNDTQTITSSVVANTVTSLRSLDTLAILNVDDSEEEALKYAIVTKLVVAVYAEALDTYLTQATEVEAEAEWWADIERSRFNVTWYLLQSLFAHLTDVEKMFVDNWDL
jgi:nuclear-control-of-ATPase protein 2